MDRELENFYDSIKNTYICFGSLEELSEITKKPKKNLEIIKTPQPFSGIIIPSLEELKKYSHALFSSLNDLGELTQDYVEKGTEKIMDIYEKIFSNKNIQNLDIRKKAQKIGADAIINLNNVGENSVSGENMNIKLNSFYGHPVKTGRFTSKFI